MSRPHLDAGEAPVERQVQADERVRGPDSSPVAADVLGAVGVDSDLVEPQQFDMIQLETTHLAVELPTLRRVIQLRVLLPIAGRQPDPTSRTDRRPCHPPMMAAARRW